jgi:hypothetical protein
VADWIDARRRNKSRHGLASTDSHNHIGSWQWRSHMRTRDFIDDRRRLNSRWAWYCFDGEENLSGEELMLPWHLLTISSSILSDRH